MGDFFSTFWRSFWSPLAYKNALEWRWKIIAYFLLLSLFSAIIMSFSVSKVVDREIANVFKHIDEFEIIDGKVKTKEEKVYTYELENGAGLVSVSEKPAENDDSYLFVIEGDMLYVNSEIMPIRYELKRVTMDKDVIVDEGYVQEFVSKILLIGLFMSTVLSNIFFVIILTLAAFTMTMTSPVRFGFFDSLKISVLAITPMVFLQSVGSLFSLQDSAGFMYGLISIGLVWYVIKKLPAYYDNEVK